MEAEPTKTATMPEGTELQAIPVRIDETSRRHHITGMMALNIPDPVCPGGDWHQYASWFATEPGTLRPHFYTDEDTYGVVLDKLGDNGVEDARAGLRLLGHPAGESDRPVWSATYDRAVIEIAWEQLQHERTDDEVTEYIPVDSADVRSWLFRTIYWVRLNWWGWKLRWSLTGRERHRWDEWRREWRPWP